MMPEDLFQMTLRLDGASMNDFGRAVSRVCLVTTGDGLATLIGLCQPERIDGGPVQ